MVHVGDPHQEITRDCAERSWLTLFTNAWTGGFMKPAWTSHPKGYLQPGVLVASREQVLYRWRCRPTRQNVGGAIARPTPQHVWQSVQDRLTQAGTEHAPYDDDPELDAKPVPWALFVMMLLANGWFVKATTFDYRPGEDSVGSRQRRARSRLIGFIVAWLVLLIVAPLWLTGGLLLIWLAVAVPQIKLIHENFQNIASDTQP